MRPSVDRNTKIVICEMNNNSYHLLSAFGVQQKDISVNKERELVYVRMSNERADLYKDLDDGATVIDFKKKAPKKSSDDEDNERADLYKDLDDGATVIDFKKKAAKKSSDDEDNERYVVVSAYGYLGFDTELGLHTFGFPFSLCKKFKTMDSARNIAREIELEAIDLIGSCPVIYVHRIGVGYIPTKFGF